MGAATFTPSTTDGTGRFPGLYIDNKRAVRGTLVLSNSYATGGDSLALTNLDIKEITGILVVPSASVATSPGLSIVLAGTKTVPLIQAVDTDGTQVTNTTNLSTRQAMTVYLLGA